MENPSNLTRIAFFGDTHRPYHHKKAWDLFLEVMRDFKPEILVCLGDLADFYKISRFGKDPTREFSFTDEKEDCLKAFDELDGLYPAPERKIFVAGNHEERLVTYLQTNAPELFKELTVPKLFQLELRGWEYVPYREHIKIGKVYVTHDVGATGPYAIFRAASTFQHPVVTGHTHRFSGIVEGDALGKHYPAWSFGWLGDVNKVDFMHKIKVRRAWSLGFGVGFQNPDTGVTHIQGVPIVNSKGFSCVVGGREYHV